MTRILLSLHLVYYYSFSSLCTDSLTFASIATQDFDVLKNTSRKTRGGGAYDYYMQKMKENL